MAKPKCECCDPGCTACGGKCRAPRDTTLYRIDQDDESGTNFCSLCASDALVCGMFTDEKEAVRC